MGCHCDEIAVLNSDISAIGSAISTLKNIASNSEKISSDLLKCADKLAESIDVTRKAVVVTSLELLNSEEPGNIKDAAEACEKYRNKLKVKLLGLKASDKAYHERMKRKNSSRSSSK